MPEMNLGERSEFVRGSSEALIVRRMDVSAENQAEVEAGRIPATLWLGIITHKEYPPGYRHAWGIAWVSTRQDGGDRYPVETLRLRIQMPMPGGGAITDDQTRHNAAECPADCKYFGVVAGDFSSNRMGYALMARDVGNSGQLVTPLIESKSDVSARVVSPNPGACRGRLAPPLMPILVGR